MGERHAESNWFERLTADDSGQDLIEQALLAAFIGVTLLLVLDNVQGAIAAGYTAWLTGVNLLWESPPPG